MLRTELLCFLLVPVFFVAFIGAQDPPSEFEVASLRRVPDPGPGMVIPKVTPGRLLITNAPLRNLIARAYDIQAARIVEAPGFSLKDLRWEQFDLEAKTGLPPASARETLLKVQPAFQKFLADRFKLQLHRETRNVEGYVLVPARNGPKLTPFKEDLDPNLIHLDVSVGRTEAVFSKAPMTALVNALAVNLGAPVVDHTGLTGNYNFTLQWVTGDGQHLTWFEAVEGQLGLKLDHKMVSADFLVIDYAEEPTEN
jgi:uncharacterized protein (TIGR03435 family)